MILTTKRDEQRGGGGEGNRENRERVREQGEGEDGGRGGEGSKVYLRLTVARVDGGVRVHSCEVLGVHQIKPFGPKDL